MGNNQDHLSSYPWFGTVHDFSLEQGDFFFNCPVFEPKSNSKIITNKNDIIEVQTDIKDYDVIILSQSCDLAQEKIETVLVCPHWSITDLEKNNKFFQDQKNKEDIRRGNVPGYHMLNAYDINGFKSPIRIVSFRQVFGLPYHYLQEQAHMEKQPRLRLLPPYREHLAQAFARFIMRVGLPVDIPAYK